MLILPIEKQWFDLIDENIKGEEYREDTPYYRARLERYIGQELECILRNGYSSSSPSMRVKALVKKRNRQRGMGAQFPARFILSLLFSRTKEWSLKPLL